MLYGVHYSVKKLVLKEEVGHVALRKWPLPLYSYFLSLCLSLPPSFPPSRLIPLQRLHPHMGLNILFHRCHKIKRTVLYFISSSTVLCCVTKWLCHVVIVTGLKEAARRENGNSTDSEPSRFNDRWTGIAISRTQLSL